MVAETDPQLPVTTTSGWPERRYNEQDLATSWRTCRHRDAAPIAFRVARRGAVAAPASIRERGCFTMDDAPTGRLARHDAIHLETDYANLSEVDPMWAFFAHHAERRR